MRPHRPRAAFAFGLLLASIPNARAEDAGVRPVATSTLSPTKTTTASVFGSALRVPADQLTAVSLESRRARIEALRAMLTGDPTDGTALQSLLGVDLLDAKSVTTRRNYLTDRIDRVRTAPLEMIATSSTSTTTAHTSTVAHATWRSLRQAELRAELDFLSQPTAVIEARVRAEKQREKTRQEQAEAQERAARAEAQARKAEEELLRAREEARQARSSAIAALKNRVATIAASHSELAAADASLLAAEEGLAKERTAFLAELQVLVVEHEQTSSGAGAQAIHGRASATLAGALAHLAKARSSVGDDLSLPQVELEIPSELRSADTAETVAELETATNRFLAYRDEIDQRTGQSRISRVEDWLETVGIISNLRFATFHALSEGARDVLLGFDDVGRAAIGLEITHLRQTTLTQLLLRSYSLANAPNWLTDGNAMARGAFILVRVIFFIGLLLWARSQTSRIKQLIAWLKKRRGREAHRSGWLEALQWVQLNAERFGAHLLFLIGVQVVELALGDLADEIEIDLFFSVILWVGYYWLLHRFLMVTIVELARRRKIDIGEDLLLRVEKSTLLVARAMFAAGLFNSIALRILGDGVLYVWATRLLFIGLLAATIVLVRRWRHTIGSAYLRIWPTGRLARLVEQTRGSWYGFFVSIAALLYVAASALAEFGREGVMRFDQSRKALAFLFRKRLERRAEEDGDWGNESIDTLPEALRRAFTDVPLDGKELTVDRFPGLDAFKRDLNLWREGRIKGSFLVRSLRGHGKTTWLNRAVAEVGGLEIVRVDFDRLGCDVRALATQLAPILELDDDADLTAIATALKTGKKRLVVLDNTQNLFLREIDGTVAIEALLDLIEETGANVFWLVAISELTWRYIRAARPRSVQFRAEQELLRWSEDDIAQLLMLRAAASGYEHQFDDLVGRSGREITTESLTEASHAYTRLIWDYADGSPRLAAHFWLRSVVPVGNKKVRVRLFREPETDRLEGIPDDALFLYAAISLHDKLSVVNAARVLNATERYCEALLVRGCEAGFLQADGDQFTMSTFWQRAMNHYLRRKHLIQ